MIPDMVVLIHTILPLIGYFDELTSEILLGVEVRHILDEPLLEGIRQRGGLQAADSARLWEHIKMAENIRARVVLVTCSRLSPLLDNLRPLTALPLIKIESAMVTAAVKAGRRLGVLATNPAALYQIQTALEEKAQQTGRHIHCEYRLVQGAFEAMLNGNINQHDRLINEAVVEFPAQVDHIVLAQASMARGLADISGLEQRVSVLTSPRLALEEVRSVLVDLGWG